MFKESWFTENQVFIILVSILTIMRYMIKVFSIDKNISIISKQYESKEVGNCAQIIYIQEK